MQQILKSFEFYNNCGYINIYTNNLWNTYGFIIIPNANKTYKEIAYMEKKLVEHCNLWSVKIAEIHNNSNKKQLFYIKLYDSLPEHTDMYLLNAVITISNKMIGKQLLQYAKSKGRLLN